MHSSNRISVRKRLAQMFWMGNAVVCAILALLGGTLIFHASGYDAPMAAVAARVGAELAAPAVVLALFSLWKVRSAAF